MTHLPSNNTSLSMLDGIRRNDPGHWDRFVLLFGPLVYEWCRRSQVPEHDAADIVQEVFRTIAVKISEFRRDRVGDSLHGWIFGITRIKCLDFFRHRSKQAIGVGGSSAYQSLQQRPEETLLESKDINPDAENAVLFRRALELLKTEFEPKTWQAFWRTTVDEVKPRELVAELGMSTGAIYNAKYKVLRRLRAEFEDLISIPLSTEKEM